MALPRRDTGGPVYRFNDVATQGAISAGGKTTAPFDTPPAAGCTLLKYEATTVLALAELTLLPRFWASASARVACL